MSQTDRTDIPPPPHSQTIDADHHPSQKKPHQISKFVIQQPQQMNTNSSSNQYNLICQISSSQNKNNYRLHQQAVDHQHKIQSIIPQQSLNKQQQQIQPSQQDLQLDDKQQDNINNRKQSSSQNRDDNQTSQIQVISGGKKCFNKLCSSKKIYKKIRSRVETQRYRFLCKNCYDNYVSNSFCQFCEQIYSNYQNQEDDTKWVGCDKCERWNHIQCQRKYRHKNFQITKDTQYQCLACSKKNRNGTVATQNGPQTNKRKPVQRDYQGTRNYRMKIQINKQERIPIFHKKPQVFLCLESFLQTYNFRLWLNDANIRQDIENLRSSSRRQPVIQQQPKKTKKIKLDY